MPYIQALDGTRLYYEEVGAGSAVVFVHEFAGDYRTWEPQLRHFARSHRCITGVAAGVGWGSLPDAQRAEAMKLQAAETGRMFAEEGIKSAAAKYADAPMRQAHKNKDPRGWSEFAHMLSEHSALGHSNTMFGVQLKRPTLWEMEADLKRFTPPLLVIVGDEDEPCLEGSFFLKRAAPTAALLVIPRIGHNVTSEEPAAFNTALAELFFAAESGRWLAHKKAT